MNTQRITISLPTYLYERLKREVPPRKVSKLITQSLEEKLLRLPNDTKDPIEDFLALRKKAPRLTGKQIEENIARGRA